MMIKKLICAAALLMVAGLQHTRAQYVYGTTGLLHAPSADMQRDKIFSVRVFLSASGGYPEALEL